MDFKSVVSKAQALTDTAADAVSKGLDEFNAALPTLRSLGFGVENLQVKMGLLPEVSARLTAAVDDIDPKTLEDLIQKKSEQKTLVALLKGLQTAYNVRNQLGELGLKGIEIDLALGIPPSIAIGFIKKRSPEANGRLINPRDQRDFHSRRGSR